MLDTKYISTVKRRMLAYAGTRRDIIKMSDDALYQSKRAIFALHQGNTKEAKKKLSQVETSLKQLQKKHVKNQKALGEGAYKAALEEYVEATLFFQFVHGEKMTAVQAVDVPDDVYIAGLCDVPGEMYRYAIHAATNRQIDDVQRAAVAAQEIIGSLIEFNLTGYLRNKFDQAKGATQKIEKIVYDLSLRQDV